MTESEIMKALECHIKRRCYECPIGKEDIQLLAKPCGIMIVELALALINRKNEEIEEKELIIKQTKHATKCAIEAMSAEGQLLIERKNKEIERLRENTKIIMPARRQGKTLFIVKKYNDVRAEAIKEFADRVKKVIEQMTDIMFDDNESKCRIEGCHYPSNIPCGNEMCLEENKAYWNAKLAQIVKEMGVE